MSGVRTPVWSYSGLRTFRSCPYRYRRETLDRAYRGRQTDAMRDGQRVHEEIAAAVQALVSGREPPATEAVERVRPILDKLLHPDRKVLVEYRMGVTADWRPCDFFAPDVWGRAVADLVLLTDDTIAIVDWKTGTWKQDDEQLLLTLAVADAHFPGRKRFFGGYWYLQEGEMYGRAFEPGEIAAVREDHEGIAALFEAWRANLWPPRPGPHCRWCPVLDCRARQR